jgi:hypothetical protein
MQIVEAIPWYIITANNAVWRKWDTMILALVIYSCAYLPVEVVFRSFENLRALNYLVDAIFVVDLILSFLKAYETDDGEVITDLSQIRTHFCRFWFWVDFPASVPIDVIIAGAGGSHSGSLTVLRLLRVGRFIRALKKMELSSGLQILRLIGGFAFLAHWLGCLWYFIVESHSFIDWANIGKEVSVGAGGAAEAVSLVGCQDEDCILYSPWLESHLQHTEATLSQVYYRWLVSVYSALCMLLGENLGTALCFSPIDSVVVLIYTRSFSLSPPPPPHTHLPPPRSLFHICLTYAFNSFFSPDPVDPIEYWVHAFALLLGAVIQAYIFGQVALLIADHNSTSSKWYTY